MRILFLDDDPERQRRVRTALVGTVLYAVETAADAIRVLSEHEFDVVMLDHDLGGEIHQPSDETSGYGVAAAIANGDGKRPGMVVIHSFNGPGAVKMMVVLSEAKIPTVWAPFGTSLDALVLC